MSSSTLVEKLPCRLTPAEITRKSSELAREIARRDELVAAKKDTASDYSRRIKSADELIADLADQVREGREVRDVEVAERRDLAHGVVTVYREDTGELVRTRPLEQHERQADLYPAARPPRPKPDDDDEDESEDDEASAH